MSDDKNKVSDKASEIAKNIWLAGVGAYGKAVDEAQDRLEKAGVETPKLFRDLVKAGSALEEDAREALEKLEASRISSKNSVEQRIERVRENFHQQRHARIEDITALHKKIDTLSDKLDQLIGSLTKKAPAKAPAKAKTKTKTKTKPRAKTATAAGSVGKTRTPKKPARTRTPKR